MTRILTALVAVAFFAAPAARAAPRKVTAEKAPAAEVRVNPPDAAAGKIKDPTTAAETKAKEDPSTGAGSNVGKKVEKKDEPAKK